ncbi:MAG: hypothetical protein ABFE08_16215 [Armatimonadia bacterium]
MGSCGSVGPALPAGPVTQAEGETPIARSGECRETATVDDEVFRLGGGVGL